MRHQLEMYTKFKLLCNRPLVFSLLTSPSRHGRDRQTDAHGCTDRQTDGVPQIVRPTKGWPHKDGRAMGITIPSETDIGAPALNRARTRSKVSHKSGENCKCAVRVANKISLKQVGADITACRSS